MIFLVTNVLVNVFLFSICIYVLESERDGVSKRSKLFQKMLFMYIFIVCSIQWTGFDINIYPLHAGHVPVLVFGYDIGIESRY